MKELEAWYDTMNSGQKLLVYVISAGLVLLWGLGLVPLAVLVYLELGRKDRGG